MQTQFFVSRGWGASELKSLHMAGHLTSNLSQLSQGPGI